MRHFAMLFAVLALAPTTAGATPVFTAPGWYQMADTIVGPFVWRGPFAGRDDCLASLPANEEDADYSCEYLETRPDWDE